MDTGVSFVVTKYISIRPGESRNMFPANDMPFTFVFDDNQSDKFSIKQHASNRPPHIHLKNNIYKTRSLLWELHPELKQGVTLRVTSDGSMKKYRLEIVK